MWKSMYCFIKIWSAWDIVKLHEFILKWGLRSMHFRSNCGLLVVSLNRFTRHFTAAVWDHYTCRSVGFFLVCEVVLKKSVHDHGSMAVKHRCLPLHISFSKVTNNSKKGRVLLSYILWFSGHFLFTAPSTMQSWFTVIVPSCYNDDNNDKVYNGVRAPY